MRPLGGWLSDNVGGARVTFWNFMLMVAGVLGLIYFLGDTDAPGAFGGFLTCFLILFFATGIGNGSTFRMIPVIFRSVGMNGTEGRPEEVREKAQRAAEKESAAAIGFSSAVAAYGAFLIPQAYSISIKATGGIQSALYLFIGFYLSCIAVTWWFYSRRNAEIPC